MKRLTFRCTITALVLFAGLLFVPMAKADSTYDFSINLTNGPVTGTLTGTLDLSFVSPGGTGSGAAGSLVFTSIPAGFGALAGGNVATSWANQVTNMFTVTSGVITSDAFFATTGASQPADVLCLNSTASGAGTFGIFGCPSGLNELNADTSVFGYNFGGLGGITFSLVSAPVPEPSSLLLLGMGMVGLVGAAKRKLLHA